MDDGSNDNSVELLSAYGDQIKLICQANAGQLAACLRGVAETNAEYIYFLDADDFIVGTTFVADVRPQLAKGPSKIQFQLEGVNKQRESLGSIFPAFPATYGAAEMREDNRRMGFYQCPPTTGNVFRRETIAAVNLSPNSKPPYIDATLPLVMPYFGEVISLHKVLACYRVHGANMGCSDWANPTHHSLQKELDNFQDSWDAALPPLGLQQPPFGNAKPLYVLERELMIGAIEGEWWLGGRVGRYLGSMRRTELSGRTKLLLTVWALLLPIPIQSLRTRLIVSRRSSANQSGWLRSVLKWVLHGGRNSSRAQPEVRLASPPTVASPDPKGNPV